MAKIKDKVGSRKFFIASGIMISSTVMMIVPAVINYLTDGSVILLSGSEYTSMIIAIYTIYSGANVAQKRWVDLPSAKIISKKEDEE